MHQRDLQVLLIEIFKCMSGSCPDIVKTLFMSKETPYSLRNSLLLKLPPTKSVRLGPNSFLFRGSQLWNSVPDRIKHSNSIALFKKDVASWVGLKCLCPLCQI